MTIRDFIRAVWAGKYYVLGAVVVVLVAGWFYLSRQQTSFQATAVVGIASPTAGTSQSQESSTSVNTDPSIVVSDPVAAKAAEALGYQGDPKQLAARVDPFYNSSTQLTDISAVGPSYADGVAVANAFAQAYVDYLPTVVQGQVDDLDASRQQLRDRLNSVNQTLNSNPTDPLAQAEQKAIIDQYLNVSRQVSSLQSIPEPGRIERAANSAISLAVSPDIVLAVALLAGLVAGVGIALAKWGLDFRVRTADEAERNARTPVVAELFGVSTAVREHKRRDLLPVSSRVASPFTESIRELRTALQVSVNQQSCIVVLITAADARAPRSFITANLAASWALSGRRTAVVAGDMRRPDLRPLLSVPAGGPDRSGMLRTDIPNLSLVPIDNDEMDPADYLASAQVAQAIADLRRRMDVIVIDAPPVLAAADAAILGGYSDGAVLIATVGRTDRDVLKEAADRLRDNDVPLTGLAVAGVRSNRRIAYAGTYGGRVKAIRASRTNADDKPSEPSSLESSAASTDQAAAAETEPVSAANRTYVPTRAAGDGSTSGSPRTGAVRPGPNSLRNAPRRLGGQPNR